MLINEVCKECNLTKKAVEYYTEQGLIQPRIKENGYRQFSETDALKLKRTAWLAIKSNHLGCYRFHMEILLGRKGKSCSGTSPGRIGL